MSSVRAESDQKRWAVWVVLLAAAGAFALTMGTRQTMGLFLSSLNTSTGLGVASISLAFAFGQLWWGLTQPFAGAMADKVGAGRVVILAPVGIEAVAGLVDEHLRSGVLLLDQLLHRRDLDQRIEAAEVRDRGAKRRLIGEAGGNIAAVEARGAI